MNRFKILFCVFTSVANLSPLFAINDNFWIGAIDDNILYANNWFNSNIPIREATFPSAADSFAPTLSGSSSYDLDDMIVYATPSQKWTFGIKNNSHMTLRGVGFSNFNQVNLNYVNIGASRDDASSLTFKSSASADYGSSGLVGFSYNLQGASFIQFEDSATASYATFDLSDASQVNAIGTTTLDHASFALTGNAEINLSDFAIADSATISLEGAASLNASDTASLLYADIALVGTAKLTLTDNATAAQADIAAAENSTISLSGYSTLGSASVAIEDNVKLNFAGHASAQTALIEAVDYAEISFADSSELSSATINLASSTATINLNQTSDTTFTGTLLGVGALKKAKEGTFTISASANTTGFTGNTELFSGRINVNSVWGGAFNVSGSGELSGTGTINGLVTIDEGGTLTPGNGSSSGTLTVNNNVRMKDRSAYKAIVGDASSSAQLDVNGNFEVGNNVSLTVLNAAGQEYTFDTDVQIITYNTIEGEFDSVQGRTPLYQVIPTYSPTNIQVRVIKSFEDVGENSNQVNVANAINSITNPTSEQQALIDNFYSLSTSQVYSGLEELSGEQYSHLLISEEKSVKHFMNRLYDPIRPYVVNTCGIKAACPDTWLEASGIRACYKDDGHAYGFKNRGYNIALGMQAPLYNDILVGAALFYEADYYTFNQEGSGRQYSLLGGLYGLYRPKDFYIFADLLGGYSFGKMSRTSTVGQVTYSNQGRPKAQVYDLYVESGFDLFNNCFIIQPFLGLNLGYNNWQSLTESSGNVASLNINGTDYLEVNSRLGLHLYTDPNPCLITFGLDVDWAYRLTRFNGYRYMTFQQFGSPHIIQSVNLAPNSLEFSLYASKEMSNSLMLYIEGNAELWRNASEGSLSLGVLYKW